MKFDSNLAWKQATSLVAANRELLLTLAGVFFFLPSFALTMLIAPPEVRPGATPEQMAAMLEPFLAAIAPWAIIGSVIQGLGQLAVLDLLGRGGRPTVGEALRKALAGLAGFIAVQLLLGFMMFSVFILVAAVGSLASPVLGFALAIYCACLVYGRFLVAGAVIVMEQRRNPFAILARAAALGRGNGWRIGNFVFLLLMAFFVGFMVLSIIIGMIAAVTLGQGRLAEIVAGFFSSAASAIAVACFAAIVTATYRQLAGGSR
ncbi:MAG: hypothetical protein LBV50_03080 [Novosphingobium sp.]|nr:hypothetical protein [Novosphingobium sp.]